MALHSPSMQLIYDWLTGAPNTSLSTPVSINTGHWILCGYGRFGKKLHKELQKRNLRTVVIDPREDAKISFTANMTAGDRFITGTGTDAKTLTAVDIQSAAGVIAGSDNDSNNLSIIMTARQLNNQIFVVGRQNLEQNKLLYSKINDHYHNAKGNESGELSTVAHLAMQPSEIIARKIRAILIAPLLIEFLDKATYQDQQWANITISRLSAVIGKNRPNIWTVRINKEDTPAIAQALGFGRSIQLKHIIRDPMNLAKNLSCVPLLLKRGDELFLLPDENHELKAFDQLLFCGLRKVKQTMMPVLSDVSLLNYVMTSKNEPRSYIWRKLTLLLKKQERRSPTR